MDVIVDDSVRHLIIHTFDLVWKFYTYTIEEYIQMKQVVHSFRQKDTPKVFITIKRTNAACKISQGYKKRIKS